MVAEWLIHDWPLVGFHAFLSHSAEDRDSLVLPVFERLQQRNFVPWIDLFEYPLGRDPLDALRDEILRCRHVIYFITPAMLRQGRGWCAAERTIADQIQRQVIWQGKELQHIEMPLIFVEPDHAMLRRSLWQPILQRGVHYRKSRRNTKESRVDWAVRMISQFIEREAEWARDVRAKLRRGAPAWQHFQQESRLIRRLRARNPPLPRRT
jgi:hypothetical protein